MKELTQERLKEYVVYDKDSGEFTRATTRYGFKKGERSGSVTKAGSRVINILGKPRAEHRLAFLYVNGEYPDRQIEHINGNKSDNRWCNIIEKQLVDPDKDITEGRLRELVSYDEFTGEFTRIKAVKGFAIGDPIGYRSEAGYIIICLDGVDYRAHRLAIFYTSGKWPPEQVDHENRIRDDNRLCNLKLCTNAENSLNSSIQSNNTSGHVGVSWDKSRGKWAAEIRSKGKRERLGRFDKLEDAVATRKAAEVKYGFSKGHGKEAPAKYKN